MWIIYFKGDSRWLSPCHTENYVSDDNNRVVLPLKPGQERTDYINASIIEVSLHNFAQVCEIFLARGWHDLNIVGLEYCFFRRVYCVRIRYTKRARGD